MHARPEENAKNAKIARIAKIILVAGAATYSSWPLASLVPTGLSQVASSASEYEATGHPWAWLFHAADIVSGLLIGVGAAIGLALTRTQRDGWPMRIMLAAVSIRGFGTAVSGSMSVDCSDSDGQCKSFKARGWQPSWHHVAHKDISGYTGKALTIGILALAVGVVIGGIGPAARRWACPLIVLLLLSGLNLSHLFWSDAQRGIAQRISEAGETVFFCVLAYDIARPPRPGWIRARMDRSHPGFARRDS